MKKAIIGIIILLSGISTAVQAGHHENESATSLSANEALAKAWVESGISGRQASRDMIAANMAEDGVWQGARYVGFGFTWDNQNREQMVIRNVTPESPASAVLQSGDVFVAVEGVPATWDNRDKLAFRGKPGVPIKAKISRDGAEMDIEVARGIIDPKWSKAQVLANVDRAEDENWGPQEQRVAEVMSKDNIVYVLHWTKDSENDTDMPFEEWSVVRFEFNDEGKVSWVGSLSEDRFVLEQLGYDISR